jgi:hypothetical protein
MPAEVPWASRAVIDKENLASRAAEPVSRDERTSKIEQGPTDTHRVAADGGVGPASPFAH